MDFLLKLCFLIFVNLFVHTHAQDLISAILGGVQDGLNLVNNNLVNNLDVGQRDYPDYEPLANRELSSLRSKDVSESNQNHNDSEEPDNNNYEQRQGGDSNWNSEENYKQNLNFIENKKRHPVDNQIINCNQQNRSQTTQPGPFNDNIQHKLITENPALLNNQKPLPLEKETINNTSMTDMKDILKSHNVTTNVRNGSGTKFIPLTTPVNGTVSNNIVPGLLVKDSLLNQNKKSSKDSKQPAKDKKDKKDKKVKKDKCENILKPLIKRKFYFQARPVIPLSEEVSTNEQIYYID